jgi:hypothetical protein
VESATNGRSGMGTPRAFETPPRAASLTDIGARRKSPIRIAGRKHGDLTNPARPASGMAFAPEPPEVLSPSQVGSAIGRSDTFDFNNLEELGVEIDADAVEITEIAHRHMTSPMLFHPDEGADESGHEPASVEAIPLGLAGAAGTATIGIGSGATEWCLAEQSHPGHTVSAAASETQALRADPADAFASSNFVSGRARSTPVTARASLTRIIAMAVGALLFVVGVVSVVVSM